MNNTPPPLESRNIRPLLLSLVCVVLLASNCFAQETLTVKGFYIGMPIDEALSLLQSKYSGQLPDPYEIRERKDGSFVISKDKEDKDQAAEVFMQLTGLSGLAGGASVEIEAGADRKVTSVTMFPKAVDVLFNTSDLDAKAFAQQFLSAYEIPELTAFESTTFETSFEDGQTRPVTGVGGWEYTSPAGYKIVIKTDKTVVLSAATKASDRSFD